MGRIKDGRARSEPGGTRWRTGGEVKGKLVNGVGSQYSNATSERGLSSITQADAHTSAASSRLNWRPPPDLNGLVRFGERRNLVSARVPSRSARAIHTTKCPYKNVTVAFLMEKYCSWSRPRTMRRVEWMRLVTGHDLSVTWTKLLRWRRKQQQKQTYNNNLSYKRAPYQRYKPIRGQHKPYLIQHAVYPVRSMTSHKKLA